MIKHNKKWFTLIELVVVILITSILMAVWSSFFNSMKTTSRNKLIVAEIDRFNSLFENIKLTDLFMEEYEDTVEYNQVNSMNKDQLIDLYYSVYIIRPVLVNKYDQPPKVLEQTDIWNTINEYKDIAIWLQQCKLLFDINWKTISWENNKTICDEPNIWDWLINIQWFLLSNDTDILVEKENYYFNSDNYFWNNFTITDGDTLLVEKWIKQTDLAIWWYHYFDLLYDRLDDFYNWSFLVYKVKKLNWYIETWVYVWTLTDFTNLIRNTYIPWVINNIVLDSSDLTTDREERKALEIWQYNDIQFLYHDPVDFTNSYKELLFFGIKNNEKN